MKKGLLLLSACVVVLVSALAWFFLLRQGSSDEKTTVSDRSPLRSGVVSSYHSDSDMEDQEEEVHGSGHLAGKAESTPSAEKQAPAEMVEKFVELSGAASDFDQMDAMLDQQVEAILENTELEGEDREKLAQLFREGLSGAALLEAYKERIASEFTREEIAELIQDAQDPVMQEVQQQNARMMGLSQEEAEKEFEKFIRDSENTPVSEERNNAITSLAENAGQGEYIADLMLDMVDIFAKDAPELTHSPEQRAEMKEQIVQPFTESMKLGFRTQLQNVSDANVLKFAAMKGKPVQVRDVKIRQDVVRKSLLKLGKRTSKAFPKKK
ncbi:MAG: hypothetical protein H6618_08010 [Deltaproteobacteria bacterium]|nr:hypothetical protein [Deltaproteobacteria bacterium]